MHGSTPILLPPCPLFEGEVSLEEQLLDEVGEPDLSTMVAARDSTSSGDSGGLIEEVPVTSRIRLELLDLGEKLQEEDAAAAAAGVPPAAAAVVPEPQGRGGEVADDIPGEEEEEEL